MNLITKALVYISDQGNEFASKLFYNYGLWVGYGGTVAVGGAQAAVELEKIPPSPLIVFFIEHGAVLSGVGIFILALKNLVDLVINIDKRLAERKREKQASED